jgi:hypothetical protein
MRRRKQSKRQEQQKKHKWSLLKSLSNWVDFGAWRELNALIVSLEYCLLSCIGREVQKTWITWVTTDWLCYRWAHRTGYFSLSGACHVSRPLGFGAVDHWSLLSFAASDSLVRSDFWLAHCSPFYCSPQSTIDAVDCCSVGSLDMYGAHRTVRWIIAERLPDKPESGQFARCLAWAPDNVRCATGSTIASLCSKLGWVPNLISFLGYFEPYAPEINDN